MLRITPSSFLALSLSLPLAPLAAQQTLDLKTPPVADPVKGMPDMSPLTPEEVARMPAPRSPGVQPPGLAAAQPIVGASFFDRVIFDEVDGAPIWAAGPRYKASFGADGFTYVPFLGSDAPHNCPVHFTLRAVRVGGRALPLADAMPVRTGDRVTFARGAVTERYDCTLEHVEQTFVVDSALPGDVDVEIAVVTVLAPDLSSGICWANERGGVIYGQAHVVTPRGPEQVTTEFARGAIRIHVPASLRGDGSLVIDPVIFTNGVVFGTADSSAPDLAYDALADQCLQVWEYRFSATDHDIYSMFRTGNGGIVPGSVAAIDAGSAFHMLPRVADLHSYSRFLVVSLALVSGRWQVYGRLRLTGSAPHPTIFPISDPSFAGDCASLDIGGDPGPGNRWLVVWTRFLNPSDTDIHARTVFADTTQGPVILVENSSNTLYRGSRVSRSNGNGATATPCWMVAYSFLSSPTDNDIYGAVIAPTGAMLVPNSPVAAYQSDDVNPSVASPLTDLGAVPQFLVTYEHGNAPTLAWCNIVYPNAGQLGFRLSQNLQTFGISAQGIRAESDGCRIAIASEVGNGQVTVATVVHNGLNLVLQDPPGGLFPTGFSVSPSIVSKRSGGGPRGEYGIAFTYLTANPDTIWVARYEGRQAGPDVVRRTMACGSLNLDPVNRPFLGETFACSLTGAPSGLFGIVEGFPHAASTAFCAACPIGIDLAGPVANFLLANSASQVIPCVPGLVGATLSMQGYAFSAGGPCPAGLVLTDTIDFTIR